MKVTVASKSTDPVEPKYQPTHGNLLHPRPNQRDTLSPEIKTEIITFQGSKYLREGP